ncbi:MAG: thiocyanate hydrolase [Pseudonocardia sp. SCN 72-86]|nr:MAG: thiocyanate hydrolase [Pseudonocardia sp. SCN 72-86]
MSIDEITDVEVPVLKTALNRDHAWDRIAVTYQVTNPAPPWKSSLDGMCDVLDCSADALAFKDRRDEEDALAETQYADLPHPESQLVALAHSLIARGVIGESALAERMETVRARLQA